MMVTTEVSTLLKTSKNIQVSRMTHSMNDVSCFAFPKHVSNTEEKNGQNKSIQEKS